MAPAYSRKRRSGQWGYGQRQPAAERGYGYYYAGEVRRARGDAGQACDTHGGQNRTDCHRYARSDALAQTSGTCREGQHDQSHGKERDARFQGGEPHHYMEGQDQPEEDSTQRRINRKGHRIGAAEYPGGEYPQRQHGIRDVCLPDNETNNRHDTG